MTKKAPQDTLTIDPIAMNVVNRIAAGSQVGGSLRFEGGLLVQGVVSGDIQVNGRLIIWDGGVACGRIRVMGDLYLFGRLGAPDADAEASILKCMGTAFVASTGIATGTLMATQLKLYEGADLQGPFKTLKPNDQLPTLRRVPGGSVQPSRGR